MTPMSAAPPLRSPALSSPRTTDTTCIIAEDPRAWHLIPAALGAWEFKRKQPLLPGTPEKSWDDRADCLCLCPVHLGRHTC